MEYILIPINQKQTNYQINKLTLSLTQERGNMGIKYTCIYLALFK